MWRVAFQGLRGRKGPFIGAFVALAIASALVRVSRLPVGSSARMTVGSLTSARAMATRCCWPPESCDGRWCMREVRPTTSTAFSMRCLRSNAERPR